jgi:hypothetical protein
MMTTTRDSDNASLVEQWRSSPTAQGAALGVVLGPIGMLLAYVFSSRDKRIARLYGALRGSLAAATAMLIAGAAVVAALTVL